MNAPRALLAAAVLAAPAVRAEEGKAPPVEVTVEPCVRIDRAQILAILALELEGTALPGQSGSQAATRVHLRCEDLEEIGIEVQDPLTKKSLARGIDLSGVQPNARARLLALAVAELVTASWMELEAHARRTPVAAAPAPPATVVAVSRARERSDAGRPAALPPETRRAVLMHGRVLGDETPLWGAGLRFARDRGAQLSLGLDVVFERGERALPPAGAIHVDALSGAAALQYRPLAGAISALVGAGVRGGAAWIYGQRRSERVDERSFVAPWGGPILTATGSWRVVRHLVVELGVESGYALVSARGRGEDQAGFGLSGLWLGVSLAMGYGT